MSKELSVKDEVTDFIIYKNSNEEIKIDVILHNETVWLNQKRMSELFDVGVPAISKHIKNIYSEGELEKDSTISILETVQKEGNRNVKRNLEFYNLEFNYVGFDAIRIVGGV